jgi:hypothetical protein
MPHKPRKVVAEFRFKVVTSAVKSLDKPREVSGQGVILLVRNFEIGRFLHLKSEIRNLELNWKLLGHVQFEISDFGFAMQESSNY